jgi:hypothetical protein
MKKPKTNDRPKTARPQTAPGAPAGGFIGGMMVHVAGVPMSFHEVT